MNRVRLIGRLATDMEVKEVNGGPKVSSFVLAVDRSAEDGQRPTHNHGERGRHSVFPRGHERSGVGLGKITVRRNSRPRIHSAPPPGDRKPLGLALGEWRENKGAHEGMDFRGEWASGRVARGRSQEPCS